MHASLRKFIKSHCVVNPVARVALIEFVRAIQTEVNWTRSEIIAELIKAHYEIGQDADRRFHICGLSLAGRWQSVDGQLEFKPGRLTTGQTYVS